MKNVLFVDGKNCVNDFIMHDKYNSNTADFVNFNRFLLVLLVSYGVNTQCSNVTIVLSDTNKK